MPSVARSATVATKFVYPSPKVVLLSRNWKAHAIPHTQLSAWISNIKLAAKADQLIEHCSEVVLLALNKTWEEFKE